MTLDEELQLVRAERLWLERKNNSIADSIKRLEDGRAEVWEVIKPFILKEHNRHHLSPSHIKGDIYYVFCVTCDEGYLLENKNMTKI